MNYIISDYSKWTKIFEAESPGRTKQTAGMGQRVVGIPVDEKSFKIKIIRDLDVLDASGKMTQESWNSILTWIKAQPKWIPYYPGLNDLKTNFVIYSVEKDNDRKQLITFTIAPRSSAPGLPANVQIVKKEDLASTISDASKASILANTAQSAANKQVDTSTAAAGTTAAASKYKLAAPLSFDDAQKSTKGQPTYESLKAAYLNLVKDPEIAKIPLFAEVKKELKAGTLGKNSVSLIKGIIAGFGIKDEYGDLVEEVNQQVIDSLAKLAGQPAAATTATKESKSYYLGLNGRRVFEADEAIPAATTAAPAGFDMAAFKAALGVTSTDAAKGTSGVTIPEGGIKQGAKENEVVGKVQQMIIDKFGKVLKSNPTFAKFVGYGADKNYGPTTAAVVGMIKKGLTDPAFGETDGSVITQAFVDRIASEKIEESYLGVRGKLVEGFDVTAATSSTSSKSTEKTKGSTEKKEKVEQGDASSSTDVSSKMEEVDTLLLAANELIKDHLTNAQTFAEYKGVNDDEQGAIDEIFGSSKSDVNSWWYQSVEKKYLAKVREILKGLPSSEDESGNTVFTEEQNQIAAKLAKFDTAYSQLKAKMTGNTSNDTYVWNYTDRNGKKTTYTVDTDF